MGSGQSQKQSPEAATVFGDLLAITYPDPDHSAAEQRFITVGMSSSGRLLIVAHADREDGVRVITRAGRRRANENAMKKKTEKRERKDELRREYDLSELKGGVRGKYAARYRARTNLVLLSPDVAEYFPDEQSVNSALRTLIPAGKRPLRRAR
ncbi:MAG: BrnT family toxin [Candidatus Acidiferrum sp.]